MNETDVMSHLLLFAIQLTIYIGFMAYLAISVARENQEYKRRFGKRRQ